MEKNFKKHEFKEERVEISYAEELKALPKRYPLGNKEDYPPKESGFKVIRLVINFALVEEQDEEKIIKRFDPPIEIKVRYQTGVLEEARNAKAKLRLAYWDGDDWVRFTEEKHKFRLEPDPDPRSGGFGYATIASWDDPPCAWGF